MLCTAWDESPPSYKDYRNRTLTKHLDKMQNQLRQIRECSLKPEDKKKLITRLIDMANDELKKQLQ